MNAIGTPTSSNATKILLLGSGELGKEVAIEAMRLGIYVIACDRYANAPAMQVAHEAHVFSMLDGDALAGLARAINPVHTMSDGDTLFCLGTGLAGRNPGMMVLATMAAEAVAQATLQAVLAAQGLQLDAGENHAALHLPSAADLQ